MGRIGGAKTVYGSASYAAGATAAVIPFEVSERGATPSRSAGQHQQQQVAMPRVDRVSDVPPTPAAAGGTLVMASRSASGEALPEFVRELFNYVPTEAAAAWLFLSALAAQDGDATAIVRATAAVVVIAAGLYAWASSHRAAQQMSAVAGQDPPAAGRTLRESWFEVASAVLATGVWTTLPPAGWWRVESAVVPVLVLFVVTALISVGAVLLNRN